MAIPNKILLNKLYIYLALIISIIASYTYAKAISTFAYSLYSAKIKYEYLDWVSNWVFKNKPFELMLFCLSFALIFISMFIWPYIYKLAVNQVGNETRKNICIVPVVTFICLISMSIIANKKTISIGMLILSTIMFIAIFAMPIIILKSKTINSLNYDNYESIFINKSGKLLLAAGSLVFILFAFDMMPLIFGNNLVLTNEFIEFSEKTIINNTVYDNKEFFNKQLSYNKFKNIDDYLETDYSQLKGDYRLRKAQLEFNEKKDLLVRKFIGFNLFEFTWQVMNRSFDLHNNQIMNPLNAWLMGNPLSSTHNLYGLGIPYLAKTYFKLVDFTYDNWLRFAFLLEWLYFISIALGVYYFFKSKEVASAVFIILVGVSFYGIYNGYFYLVNAQIPINPIRHGTDFLAIISFGLYLKRKDALSLACIFCTCSVAIMLGDHFGLALTSAFAITLLIHYAEDNRKPLDYLTLLLFVMAALATIKLSSVSGVNNISVAYFIDGFFSWTTVNIIKQLLIVYSCLYLFLFYFYVNNKTDRTWYLTLLLTLYSNMLCFHYVWHGVIVHLGISMTINCILIVCYTLLLFEVMQVKKYVYIVWTIIGLLIICPNYKKFHKTKNDYNSIVNNHMIYTWDYDVATFKTTMPKEYFASAIHLVNKYSASDNGIYMISKYDYMLPVLTRKYSKMKYPNLPYFLVTKKEADVIFKQIQEEAPELIYIDTDIMLDGQLWTANNFLTLAYPGLYSENQLRLRRLNELKRIFINIQQNYRLVEKGLIIDVYKRLY